MKLAEQVLAMREAKPVADFITDSGRAQEVKDAKTGKVVMVLPRYGVWGDKGRNKPEVIETGNDLKALMKKHNISKDKVFKLGK